MEKLRTKALLLIAATLKIGLLLSGASIMMAYQATQPGYSAMSPGESIFTGTLLSGGILLVMQLVIANQVDEAAKK